MARYIGIAVVAAAVALAGCHKSMTPAAETTQGYCYSNGIGVPKNYATAFYLFKKAADQGYARAEIDLGSAYAMGRGVPKNYKEAVYWFRKAAEKRFVGLGYAEAKLGMLYYLGDGVSEDYVRAYKWFALAKAAIQPGEKGSTRISHLLRLVASRMSPSQIAHAQSLASKWERAHESQ